MPNGDAALPKVERNKVEHWSCGTAPLAPPPHRVAKVERCSGQSLCENYTCCKILILANTDDHAGGAMSGLPARDERGRLLPGHSLNPEGRPKVASVVKAMAKEASPAAMEKLIELTESDDPKIALAAIIELLNRAMGRPVQAVEKTVDHNVTFNFLSALRAVNEADTRPPVMIDLKPNEMPGDCARLETKGEISGEPPEGW